MADVLDVARARYGDGFADVLAGSRVWLNGEPADPSAPVTDRDEVAVLPPVSGGATPPWLSPSSTCSEPQNSAKAGTNGAAA